MFLRSPVDALEALSQQSFSPEGVESIEVAVFRLSFVRLLSEFSLPVSLFVGVLLLHLNDISTMKRQGNLVNE